MTNDFEPIKHKIPASSTYFFYYGAIHPRKNIENAIKAYNLFRAQNEGQILFLFAEVFKKISIICPEGLKSQIYLS